MKIYNVSKRVRSAVVKFLFLHLNNSFRVMVWRRMGVTMGKNCRINCMSFSPESYLIELGDDVVIGQNVFLITHEGSICVFQRENPNIDLFGPIKIGSNTFVGMNSLILPNSTIGENCVIGAGTVVRGNIPDNSVVMGNPAKVVMTTDHYRKLTFNNPVLYDYKTLTEKEKKKVLLERINKK